MARRAVLLSAGFILGWCLGIAIVLGMAGCANAGQIHTRAAAMPLTDRDSLDCNAPGLPRSGGGSLLSWVYRNNGALVMYDSMVVSAPGVKINFPSIWLASGRYYEEFAARDSGGISCFVRRWFTIRGVPKSPTPDPLSPGEQ